MKRLALAMTAIAATFALSTTAIAATSATVLDVTVNIQPACTITTMPVSFANYPGGSVDAAGSINVNCVSGTSYSVGIDNGSFHTGANRNVGIEFNLTDKVPYALYKNAARTTEFGDGANHGGPLSGQVGNGASQSIAVYGRLLPGATLPPAGRYTDFVTVTVTY